MTPTSPFAAWELLRNAAFLCLNIVLLGWVYHHTRRPAALAYLAWIIYGRTLGNTVFRLVIDNRNRDGGAQAVAGALFVLGTVSDLVGTVLFVWLIVSLLAWAKPALLRLPRPRPRSSPEDLAGRFGPPPSE